MMTLVAILMVFALLLNILLAITTIRSVSDVQKRVRMRMELDDRWRDSITERLRRVEKRNQPYRQNQKGGRR